MKPIQTLFPHEITSSMKFTKAERRVLEFDPQGVYLRLGSRINIHKRYQNDVPLEIIFPNPEPGLCGCGCGQKLVGRQRRWANKECTDFALLVYWIIKGDVSKIKSIIWEATNGCCIKCKKPHSTQLDHIVAVCNGGGGCWLGNYQLLCVPCHGPKSGADRSKKNKSIINITSSLFD